MPKPIRVVFCKNGQPHSVDGRVDDHLWTAHGHHWLKSDGPFPYDGCEEWHVDMEVSDGCVMGLHVLLATPPLTENKYCRRVR